VRVPLVFVAIALLVGMASTASAQQRPADDVFKDFSARLSEYSTLRSKMEQGLPVVAKNDDPVNVRSVELALARKIRTARATAHQGEIFTPQVASAFRKILKAIDSDTWKEIMDENPGAFPTRVNDAYPKTRPLSTVPPNLLARLPKLPDGLEYRFVGSNLILHDTKSNLIVDRIPEAISMGRPPQQPLPE
jgi:hypothetical protein